MHPVKRLCVPKLFEKTHNLLIICKEILSTIEIVKKIKYFVLYFNQACELGYTGGKC